MLLAAGLKLGKQTDLFICGAPSGQQVQVESSKTQDWDKKQPWHTDHYQTESTHKENYVVVVSLDK